MKIKKILNQMRRDFTAIFECEHCGFEEKRDQCGKTAGDDYRPLATKYDGGQVI